MSSERTNEIDAAASDWLIRRDSGQWTETDQARFDQWLSASTLNRVAFLRLELVWEDAARLKALGGGIPGDQPPPPGHWNLTPFFDQRQPTLPFASDESESPAPREGRAARARDSRIEAKGNASRPWGRLLAAAAALVLAVGLGTYLEFTPRGDPYATPIGGIASVPMTDGSKVTLNTDSQIRVSLTDTERRIDLTHGEAFFEVAKDPKRPFIVSVGSKRVIAVGTKFSVRRQGDDMEIVVTEGKVRVAGNSSPPRVRGEGAGGEAPRADGSADVFLTPGSVARAGHAGVLVQRKTLPEAEEQLSWRVGLLTFRNQSLAETVAEFNRYNVRKIIIEDSAIAGLKIEGNFRATNIEAFVRLLESGFPVRATTEQDRIVLTSK